MIISKGDRKNKDKPIFHVLPPDALLELGKLYAWAESKYPSIELGGKYPNFAKGMSVSETLNSMKRHILAYEKGEEIDVESGCSHMAAVAWGAIVLLHQQRNHFLYHEFDDRPYKKLHQLQQEAIKVPENNQKENKHERTTGYSE